MRSSDSASYASPPAAPSSNWIFSSSWAASLLGSSSGGGSSSDHTDDGGDPNDFDSVQDEPPEVQTISLEAALAAARNTLAAHYPAETYLAKYLTSLGRSDLTSVRSGAAPGAASGGARPAEAPLQNIIPVTLASVFVFVGAAFVLAIQLRRNRRGAGGCRRGDPNNAADGSCCGRRLSLALGKAGASSSSSTPAAAKYAPEPYQPAVIVVTDIESSTALWEELPADVMAAALRLHHATVRRLLLRHEGYESATEGDSFIAVFRSAQRAVAFGADLQTELVRQPWPRQLLEHPLCKPVYTLLPELYPFERKRKATPMVPPPSNAQQRLCQQHPAAGRGAGGEQARAQQQQQQQQQGPPPAAGHMSLGGAVEDAGASGPAGAAPPTPAAAAADPPDPDARRRQQLDLLLNFLHDDDVAGTATTTATHCQLVVVSQHQALTTTTWCDDTITEMEAVSAALGGGSSTGGRRQQGGKQQQQQLPQSGSFKMIARSSYCSGLAASSQQLGRQHAPVVQQQQQQRQQQNSPEAPYADGSSAAGNRSAVAAVASSQSYFALPGQHPHCTSAPPSSRRRDAAAVAEPRSSSSCAHGRAAATAMHHDEQRCSSSMLEAWSPADDGGRAGYASYAWALGSGGLPPALAAGPADALFVGGPTAVSPPHDAIKATPEAEAASRAEEGAAEAPPPPPQHGSLRRQHLASRLVRFFRREHTSSASAAAAGAAASEPASKCALAHPGASNAPGVATAGVAAGAEAAVGSSAASALARRNPSHLQLNRFNTASSLSRGSNPYSTPRRLSATSPRAGASDEDLFDVSLALAPVAEVVPSSTDGMSREHSAAPAAAASGRAEAAASAALRAAANQMLLPPQGCDATAPPPPASAAAHQPLSPPAAPLIPEAVMDIEEDEETNFTMAFLAAGSDGGRPPSGWVGSPAGASLYAASSRCASGGPAPPAVVAPPPSPRAAAGLQQQHQQQPQQRTPQACTAHAAAASVQRLAAYFSARSEADVRFQNQGCVSVQPPLAGAGSAAAKRPTTLVFRGLRVRVGIWAVPSLSPAELRHNAAAARLVVGGPSLAAAKALTDMAHGGQVLAAAAAVAEGVLQQELRYLKLKSATGGGGIALLWLGTYSDLGRHQAEAAAAQSAAVLPPEETTLTDLSLDVDMELSHLQLQQLRLRSVHGIAAPAPAPGTPVRAPLQPLPRTQQPPRLQQSEMLSNGGAVGADADDAARLRRGTTDVLCVVPAALSTRLVHTPPLRVPATLGRVTELHDAPTASMCYLVVQAPKVAALMAWDAELAGEWLRLFRDMARRLLIAAPVRGYQVPAREDQVHVAFPSSAAVAALCFAEALRLALLDAPWPQALLLEHELGEKDEVSACTTAAPTAASAAVAAASAAVGGLTDAELRLLLHDRGSSVPPPRAQQAPISAAQPSMTVRKTPAALPTAAPDGGAAAGAAAAGGGASGARLSSTSGWNLLRFFPTSSAGGAPIATGGDDAAAVAAGGDGHAAISAVGVPTTPAAPAVHRLIAAASSALATPRKVMMRWNSANHRVSSSSSSSIPVAQPPAAAAGVCRTAAGMLQHTAAAFPQQQSQHLQARPLQLLPHRASVEVPSRLRLAYGSVASVASEGGTSTGAVVAGGGGGGATSPAAANSNALLLLGLAPAAARAEPVLEEQRLAFTPMFESAELRLPDDDSGRPADADADAVGGGGIRASQRPESWSSVGLLLGSSPPDTQPHLLHSTSRLLLTSAAAARNSSRGGGGTTGLGSGCGGMLSSGGLSWQQQVQQQQQQRQGAGAAAQPVSGSVSLTGPLSNGSDQKGDAVNCRIAESVLDPVRIPAYYYSQSLGSAAATKPPTPPTAEPLLTSVAAAVATPEGFSGAAGSLRYSGCPAGASDRDSTSQQLQDDSHRGGWSSAAVAAAAGGWRSSSAASTATHPPISQHRGAAAVSVQQQPDQQRPQVMPMKGLRIRMGLATGAAEWRISRSTQALVYTGATVAAAAKLASIAASGQLLCDRATHMHAAAAAAAAAAAGDVREGTLPPPATAVGLAPAVVAALCNQQPTLAFSPLERSAAPLTARGRAKVLSGAQMCSFARASATPATNAVPAAAKSTFGASGLRSAPVAAGSDVPRSPLLALRPSDDEPNLQQDKAPPVICCGVQAPASAFVPAASTVAGGAHPASPSHMLPRGSAYAYGVSALQLQGRAFARVGSSSLASAPAHVAVMRSSSSGSTCYAAAGSRKQLPQQQSQQELFRMYPQLPPAAAPARVEAAMGEAGNLNAVVAAVAAAAAGPYGGSGGAQPSGGRAVPSTPSLVPSTAPRPRSQQAESAVPATGGPAEVPHLHLQAPPPAAAAAEIGVTQQQQPQSPRIAASPLQPSSPYALRPPSRLRLLTTACGTMRPADVPSSSSRPHHTAASSTTSNTAASTATGMAILIASTTSQSYSRMPAAEAAAAAGGGSSSQESSLHQQQQGARLLSSCYQQARTSFDLLPGCASSPGGELLAPASADLLLPPPPPPFSVVMAASASGAAASSSEGQISSACAPPMTPLASSGMFMFANATNTTTASNCWGGGVSTNARLASLPELPERGPSAYQHEDACLPSVALDAVGGVPVAGPIAGPGAAYHQPSEHNTNGSGSPPRPPTSGVGRATTSSGGGSPFPELLPQLQVQVRVRSPTRAAPPATTSSSHDSALLVRTSRTLLRSSASGPATDDSAAAAAGGPGAAAPVARLTRTAATLTSDTAAAGSSAAAASAAPGSSLSSQGTIAGGAAGAAQQIAAAAGSPVASPRLRRLSSVRYQGGFDLVVATSAHSTASGLRRRGGTGAGDDGASPADVRRTHTSGGADNGSHHALHALAVAGAAAGGSVTAASLRLPSFLRSSLSHHVAPSGSPNHEEEQHQQQQQRQQQQQDERAGLWSPFDASAVPCSPFVQAVAAETATAARTKGESSLAFWAAGPSAGGGSSSSNALRLGGIAASAAAL